MHNEGVCNINLTLQDILVTRGVNGQFVIKFTNNGLFEEGSGTAGYVAPEILEDRPQNGKKVDIFSLGVILFGLVTGKFPFTNVVPSSMPQGRSVLSFDLLYGTFCINKQLFWS